MVWKANYWNPRPLYSGIMAIEWRHSQNAAILKNFNPILYFIIKNSKDIRLNNARIKKLGPAPPNVSEVLFHIIVNVSD